MDAFGDDFTAVSDVDPAAEFLAREQDQLAGLEDLIPEVSQPEIDSSNQGLLHDALAFLLKNLFSYLTAEVV